MPWRATSRTHVAVDAAQLARLARWADVVLLQRPNQPEFVLRAVQRMRCSVVIDIDDALWVSSQGTWSGSYGDRVVRAVRSASAVTVGSDHLHRWVRDVEPSVRCEVIRPATPLESAVRPAMNDRDVVLGWIGTPGNFRDLELIAPALQALVGQPVAGGAGRIRLRVVSSEPYSPNGVDSEFVPWHEATQADALAGFDIGLMPLHDDERSRGRCGFKAIQYFSAGRPVVASPVGAAEEIVDDGVSGRLAGSVERWVDAITELAERPDLRARFGQEGRRWVKEHASEEVSFGRLLDLLEAIAP